MPTWEDTLSLRFVLDLLAMDALQGAWRNAGKAPVAFAGYGGGAKFAGWLSVMFASQHAHVVGVYQASIEDETLINAAMQFQVLTDATYLDVPVYLYGGASDTGASAERLRDVQKKLQRFGYKNVDLAFREGSAETDPLALRHALDWFRDRPGVAITPSVR